MLSLWFCLGNNVIDGSSGFEFGQISSIQTQEFFGISFIYFFIFIFILFFFLLLGLFSLISFHCVCIFLFFSLREYNAFVTREFVAPPSQKQSISLKSPF